MQVRKLVREGQVATDIKKLTQKHMHNGSKYADILRVDYLKYDNCYNLHISSKLRYFAMYKALN